MGVYLLNFIKKQVIFAIFATFSLIYSKLGFITYSKIMHIMVINKTKKEH